MMDVSRFTISRYLIRYNKEFATALFIFSYLAFASFLLSTFCSYKGGDAEVHFNQLNSNKIVDKHPLDMERLFAPFAYDFQVFNFAIAFIPSIIFSIIIGLSFSRRVAVLSAISLPFIIPHSCILAQNITMLLILVSIIIMSKRFLSGFFIFIMGILSHRFAWPIGILLGFAYLASGKMDMRWLGIGARIIIIASIAFMAAIFIAYDDSCQFIPKSTFLIGVPIWIMFTESKDRKMLIFFSLMLASSMFLFIIQTQDWSQRRVALMLTPITILGLGFSRKKPGDLVLISIFLIGLALLLYYPFFQAAARERLIMGISPSVSQTCNLGDSVLHRINTIGRLISQ